MPENRRCLASCSTRSWFKYGEPKELRKVNRPFASARWLYRNLRPGSLTPASPSAKATATTTGIERTVIKEREPGERTTIIKKDHGAGVESKTVIHDRG
jgi:hypothetical protein